MEKTMSNKPLMFTLSAGLSLALSSTAGANSNIVLQAQTLAQGYQNGSVQSQVVADQQTQSDSQSKSAEGKCGEGKCSEGKCGNGKCGNGQCGESGSQKKNEKSS